MDKLRPIADEEARRRSKAGQERQLRQWRTDFSTDPARGGSQGYEMKYRLLVLGFADEHGVKKRHLMCSMFLDPRFINGMCVCIPFGGPEMASEQNWLVATNCCWPWGCTSTLWHVQMNCVFCRRGFLPILHPHEWMHGRESVMYIWFHSK